MQDNLENIIMGTQARLVLFLRGEALKGAPEYEDDRLALLKAYYANNFKTLPPELFSPKIVWDYVNGRTQAENMRPMQENEAAMRVIALAVYDAQLVLVVDSLPGNAKLKTLAGYVLAWELKSGSRTPDLMGCVGLRMAAWASQDPWLERMALETLEKYL